MTWVQWAWLILIVLAAIVAYIFITRGIAIWIRRNNPQPRFVDLCHSCGHPNVEHEPLSVEIEGSRLSQCQICGEACLP